MRSSILIGLMAIGFLAHADETNSKLSTQGLKKFYCTFEFEDNSTTDIQVSAKDADAAVQILTVLVESGAIGKLEKPVSDIACRSVHFPSNM